MIIVHRLSMLKAMPCYSADTVSSLVGIIPFPNHRAVYGWLGWSTLSQLVELPHNTLLSLHHHIYISCVSVATSVRS